MASRHRKVETPAAPDGGLVFPDRLLRDYEAAMMLGRSRAQFRKQVKSGDLPPPVKDGRMARWRQSDLLTVIRQLQPGAQ